MTDRPTNKRPGGPVFGLGLSKTGTTSLGSALRRLGLNSIHWPIDPQTVREIDRGRTRLSIFDQYDAVVDCATCIVAYQELARMYPAARFVLSVRSDRRAWSRSIERHWSRADQATDWDTVTIENNPAKYAAKIYRHQVFGGLEYDRRHYLDVYERHWSAVLLAFREAPQRLLVHDFEQGYRPLARFLGRPVPDDLYPCENVTV